MTESLQKIWNLKEIDILPAVTPAEKFNEKGLEAVFYDNVPWKGKPTKVFAWYGVPENASAENPVPAARYPKLHGLYKGPMHRKRRSCLPLCTKNPLHERPPGYGSSKHRRWKS